MINYSRLIYKLKRNLSTFSNKITKNLTKPKSKFFFQVLYGLLENQTVLLSEISRALKEKISLKKTIDRLSRNLKNFDNKDFKSQNIEILKGLDFVKKHFGNRGIYTADRWYI
ncbi:hypothetical protein [Halanaerobium congolense]|jgi:hypothetical protein|uniref:Transposase n=2 Tax=Halanaerobium congolense TaxID=54121 RepID=A0A4V3GX46_9FIRM|nr:hypothetical protein [Halanaerobium congolense]TDX46419.1 hypothetical protein C7954_10661 [Halanaerobium congolense]SET72414.1 hypothetical protein SAMN04515653_1291 [Halanaerobium congolense]